MEHAGIHLVYTCRFNKLSGACQACVANAYFSPHRCEATDVCDFGVHGCISSSTGVLERCVQVRAAVTHNVKVEPGEAAAEATEPARRMEVVAMVKLGGWAPLRSA
jgi:hypothetical protein